MSDLEIDAPSRVPPSTHANLMNPSYTKFTYSCIPINASFVCIGQQHVVYVASDRKSIYACGSNDEGQLGTNEKIHERGLFTLCDVWKSHDLIVGIKATDCATIVLTADGSLWGFGSLRTATGDNFKLNPMNCLIKNVVSFACCSNEIVAVKQDGSVVIYSVSSSKDGWICTTSHRFEYDAVKCFAGGNSMFIILKDTSVYARGANSCNQLQIGVKDIFADTWTISAISKHKGIKQMAFGSSHVVLLDSCNFAFGFGNNQDGQLDLFSRGPMKNVQKVQCGDSFTMILLKDGSVLFSGVCDFLDESDDWLENHFLDIKYGIVANGTKEYDGELFFTGNSVQLSCLKISNIYACGSSVFLKYKDGERGLPEATIRETKLASALNKVLG